MAQSQKMTNSPVVIPSSITTLVEVFSIESEEAAKALIAQAAAAIYFENEDKFDVYSSPRHVSEQEIDGVYALMKAIKPLDTIESLYSAQIVAGHMLGMRKLAQSSRDDQRLGLKLLRLSSDAMERLEKRRNGAPQNINVIYNNTNQQALITSENRKE